MARRFRLPKSVEELAEWYMHYVSPLSLIAGFLLDTFFLAKRVDLFLTNALLFTYLIVSAAAIFLINFIEAGKLREKIALRLLPLLPVVVQFCFGGLFSAYLSLYSRSANIAISWIFVIVLAALILLNERFSHFYRRFSVQVSFYFVVLFSFLIFFLPVVFKTIGPFMFLGSGTLAVAIIAIFLSLLFRYIPSLLSEKGRLRRCVSAIGTIYLLFNVLYFTNIIPPLPLALKSAGVYHTIDKLPDGTYRLTGERLPWYEEYLNYAPIYHRAPGEPIYVWSAIFAPSGLTTDVVHEWQRYDKAHGRWITESVVRFPIMGGRDGGYRGYSEKVTGAAGTWRVNVVTSYGQLIGRIAFTVADASTTPLLVTQLP